MKVYKIKHIPTGLFYKPSQGNGNLSKNGKIYQQLPSIKKIQHIKIKICTFRKEAIGTNKILQDYFKFDWNNGYVDLYFDVPQSDWEIIEFQLDDYDI